MCVLSELNSEVTKNGSSREREWGGYTPKEKGNEKETQQSEQISKPECKRDSLACQTFPELPINLLCFLLVQLHMFLASVFIAAGFVWCSLPV